MKNNNEMPKEKIVKCLNLIRKNDLNTLKGFDMPHEELEEEIEALGEAIKLIEQKQKTGHWIKTPKAVMGEGYMWYCDNCEHQVYQDSSRNYPSENYCPNCGESIQSTRYEGFCCYQRVYDDTSYHYETVEVTEFPKAN
jgi:hypothetical protein